MARERAPEQARRIAALLLSPRVRRLRRWSFVITLPAAALSLWLFGIEGAGIVLALRLVLFLLGLVAVLRLPRDLREAALDLIMHPVLRRLQRLELRVLLTLPRALFGGSGFSYHRGSLEGALVLAFLPALVTEAMVVQLLVPDSWRWIELGALAVHAYAVVWLLGWALGPRAYPHRLHSGRLEVRLGVLYRASIPISAIETVEERRLLCQASLELRDGMVLLATRGCANLVLSLTQPIEVERPLGDPIATTRIALPADDPASLAAVLRRPLTEQEARRAPALDMEALAEIAALA